MADRERSNDQVKLEITFSVYQLLPDNTKTGHIQRHSTLNTSCLPYS